MSMSFEQFKADLISKGMLVAAERLVAPNKRVPAPVTQPRVVSESTPIPEGFRRVSCAKACRATTLQPKSEPGKRWLCAEHSGETQAIIDPEPEPEAEIEVDCETPVLYHHGNLYEPHIINFDGVAFRQRNGKVVTLEPSKVEWIVPPKY